MRLRTRLLAPLFLIAVGCSSEGSTHDPDTAALKAQAEAELKSHRAGQSAGNTSSTGGGSSSSGTGTDPCVVHAWYADGECDAWCPQGDSADCDAPIVCPLYALLPDGVCELVGPCSAVNDPDCAADGGAPPVSPPPAPDSGCVPPEQGDGVCDPKTYEAFLADPDCMHIACPAIAGVADGKCVVSTPCDFVIDPDCGPITVPPSPPGGGVACAAIAYPRNGKCEAPAGCEANDPDCSTVCIAIAYPADGKCQAAPGCESSDPDCK